MMERKVSSYKQSKIDIYSKMNLLLRIAGQRFQQGKTFGKRC